MYLTMLILPLIGSIVSGLLGRKIGGKGAQVITIICLTMASILATIAFYEVGLCGSPVTIDLGSWIDSEILTINWIFYFDSLTVSMLIPVLYISTLIHIYTVDYLSTDPHIQRFYSYLSLFVFWMLILICGGNYFVMFCGWEGIGIVSYLLINFWFTRIQANKSSMLALLMNRGGDFFLSLGFFAIFALFGSLDFSTIYSIAPYLNETGITVISLLLFAGSIAKSANLPLSSWLPGSMEAPTPVSSLLHAATLVTAGIYLLIRSTPIIEFSTTALLIITLVGATSAFVAATVGLVQNDVKRIIAFSTLSQLGYMMFAIGISQTHVALFHTICHAYFKALLFLCAGSIIHAFADQQDVRRMGGLKSFLPFIYSAMLVGSLSLVAFFFLSGFYSKDLILELAYAQYSFSGIYAYILGSTAAGLTAFYSFRLISLVFISEPNGSKQAYVETHEANLTVIIPLTILALFSIFFGYIFSDLFVGIGSDFLAGAIFTHPNHIALIDAEFSLPLYIKLLPAAFTLFGAFSALYFYNFAPLFLVHLTDHSLGRNIYTFLNAKYFLDILYNNFIFLKGFKLGYSLSKYLDRGVIELIGPHGLTKTFLQTGFLFSRLDTGVVTTYSMYISLALLLFIFIIFSPFLFSFFLDFRLLILFSFSSLVLLWGFLSGLLGLNKEVKKHPVNIPMESLPSPNAIYVIYENIVNRS